MPGIYDSMFAGLTGSGEGLYGAPQQSQQIDIEGLKQRLSDAAGNQDDDPESRKKLLADIGNLYGPEVMLTYALALNKRDTLKFNFGKELPVTYPFGGDNYVEDLADNPIPKFGLQFQRSF